MKKRGITENLATEHEEQVAFFEWCDLMTRTNRFRLDLAFAIPNGGARHISVAKKLKAEGVKAGVPDIFIPLPMNGWHGLFIEMKRKVGGKLDEKQASWLAHLTSYGYKCAVCKGWFEAKDVVLKYMEPIQDEPIRSA